MPKNLTILNILSIICDKVIKKFTRKSQKGKVRMTTRKRHKMGIRKAGKRLLSLFLAAVLLLTTPLIPVQAETMTQFCRQLSEVTPVDGQEKNDGLLYVDGVVYSGYYMESF